MAEIESDKLRVFVVWTPRLPADSRNKAVAATKLVEDKRASHFWDRGGHFGSQYGKLLKLPGKRTFAWDVYFVFDAGAKWNKAPPMPTEWMHQLGGGEDKRRLDGDKLRQTVKALLGDVKGAH